MVYLASDNISAVHPSVLHALQEQPGYDHAYGHDLTSQHLRDKYRTLFEHDALEMALPFNGSSANSLALATLCGRGEAFICHAYAHVQQDECGMPELFSGAKALTLAGTDGKITTDALRRLIMHAHESGVHHVLPKALTLTQPTECGTLYSINELRTLCDIAHENDIYVHIDGARFGNALATMRCEPAELSWRCGADMLSFGLTKNGGLCAEAVLCFTPSLAPKMLRLQKHVGQLASKQRYLSAQHHALLDNNLWLSNASHANDMANALAEGLASLKKIEIIREVSINMVFMTMPNALVTRLHETGHYFYDWPLLGDNTYRLVTSYSTTKEDIATFVKDCTIYST